MLIGRYGTNARRRARSGTGTCIPKFGNSRVRVDCISQIQTLFYRPWSSALLVMYVALPVLVMYVALPVLVTLTGVLETLTNTSQTHCLRIQYTRRLGTDPFLFQSQTQTGTLRASRRTWTRGPW